MKTRYKNLLLGATALIVPLKCSKSPEPIVKTSQKIVSYKPFTDGTLSANRDMLDSILNVPLARYKEMEILRQKQNIIKVPKPSINMDVTKTRFEGNPEFLNRFLEGKLKSKGQQFYNAQEKYGINATFLIGIANHESAMGKSDYAINRNNIAGMRNSSGYMHFNSIDECIDKMAANLKEKYTDKGLTTIIRINGKYAETTDWSEYIVKHMNPIYKSSQAKIYDFSKLK